MSGVEQKGDLPVRNKVRERMADDEVGEGGEGGRMGKISQVIYVSSDFYSNKM
jgi:hypothetical protein